MKRTGSMPTASAEDLLPVRRLPERGVAPETSPMAPSDSVQPPSPVPPLARAEKLS